MKDKKLKMRNLHSSQTGWVGRGIGTLKDKDEVNRREFYEFEG
jgi:hypothetical protein